MISSFKYLSPVQEAYSKVVESETADNQQQKQTKELLDSKKGSPTKMSDEERKLFYQYEIKRLRRIQKHFDQQRKYVNGQGYANYALKNTIEKYQRELDRMNQVNQANTQANNQTNIVPTAQVPTTVPTTVSTTKQ